MNIQKILDLAREEQKRMNAEWEVERRKREAEMKRAKERAQIQFFYHHRLRPADMKDYLSWLRGYIERGGKPTHVYDYPFSRWKFYVATRDIEPVALYGADAIQIIIPVDINVAKGNWGHCNLFFMDGYRASGIVPIFEDTNFEG